MAYFPFMVDIKGMNCLVAGGGRVALHKVKILLEYGVHINVFAPDICDELFKIATNKCVKIFKREFCEDDVNGMAFVIAATDNREVNIYISEICRSRNIICLYQYRQREKAPLLPHILREKYMILFLLITVI